MPSALLSLLYTLYCITYTPKYSGFLKFVYKINTTLNPLPHIQILIPFSIFLRYPWNVPWQTFFDFCSKWSPNSIYQNIYNLDEVEDYSRRQFNRLKINFLHRSRRGAFIQASYYTNYKWDYETSQCSNHFIGKQYKHL